MKYFTDRYGFPVDKISATGFGQYRPLVPNASEEQRATNRRVVIEILI